MKRLMLILVLFLGIVCTAFSQGEIIHLKETGVFIAKYEGKYLRTFDDSPFVFVTKKQANADYFESAIDAYRLIKKYHEQKTGEGVDVYSINFPDEKTEIIQYKEQTELFKEYYEACKANLHLFNNTQK
jgi:hypothetical protein